MVTGASTRSGLRGADRTPAPPGTDTRVRKTVAMNRSGKLTDVLVFRSCVGSVS